MCTGAEALLAASLLSTAAGTGVAIKSSRDVTKARNAAAATELLQKKKVDQDSQQLFAQTVQGSNPATAAADADQAAQQEYAATKDQIAQSATGFGGAQTQGLAQATSPVVKEAAARSLADALQTADSQIKARATLRGLGVQRQQRGDQLRRANQQANMLGNFMQGWGQVGQVGQEAAKSVGDQDAMLGDLLTGLGQAGAAYAGTMKTPTPAPGGSLVSAGSGLTQGPYDLDPSLFRSQLGPSSAASSMFAGYR